MGVAADGTWHDHRDLHNSDPESPIAEVQMISRFAELIQCAFHVKKAKIVK